MMLDLAIQGLVNGLLIAGVYMLIAAGLTLVFGSMRLANFAHGDMLMLGLYLSFFAVSAWGLSLYAVPLIAVPLTFLMGVLTYYGLIRPIIDSPPEAMLLTMVGLHLVIQNAALITFGPQSRSVDIASAPLQFGSVFLTRPRLVAGAASGIVVFGLSQLLRRSHVGRAIRATSEDRQAAQAAGVNISKTNAYAFGLGVGSLGVAAPLVLPFFSVTPGMGLELTLIGFLIIIMGGLGSYKGALIAALIVGVADGLGGVLIGGAHSRAMLFGIFVLVIIFRPNGLYGVQKL